MTLAVANVTSAVRKDTLEFIVDIASVKKSALGEHSGDFANIGELVTRKHDCIFVYTEDCGLVEFARECARLTRCMGATHGEYLPYPEGEPQIILESAFRYVRPACPAKTHVC